MTSPSRSFDFVFVCHQSSSCAESGRSSYVASCNENLISYSIQRSSLPHITIPSGSVTRPLYNLLKSKMQFHIQTPSSKKNGDKSTGTLGSLQCQVTWCLYARTRHAHCPQGAVLLFSLSPAQACVCGSALVDRRSLARSLAAARAARSSASAHRAPRASQCVCVRAKLQRKNIRLASFPRKTPPP